jgi:alpha-glucosidase (family GH31 glycosyl hydrolase)
MSGANEAYDPIAAVAGWRLDTAPLLHGFELQLDLTTTAGKPARLIARAISPDTWKLSLLPQGVPAPQPTPMVVPREARPVRLTARTKKDGRLVVSGPELSLEIRPDPFGVRFLDREGRSVLADNPGDIDGLGRPAVRRLGFALGPDGRPAGITAAFHLRPGERIYGFGEKFTRLDKAGQRIVSWTVDALGSTSERSHKNVPFLWTPAAPASFSIRVPASPGTSVRRLCNPGRSRRQRRPWTCTSSMARGRTGSWPRSRR